MAMTQGAALRIKGTFLKDYVKLVLDNPQLNWNKYLTDADWALVRGAMIIPTAWYPAETMGNIGRGIFELRVNKDYALVRAHGRARATESFDEATKKFLDKGDPLGAIKSYVSIAARFIDEVKVTVERSSPGLAEVCFFPVETAPSWDLFREIQAGTLEKLAELNGGREARAEIRTEKREGRDACIIRVEWK
jgi:hypothetical protein